MKEKAFRDLEEYEKEFEKLKSEHSSKFSTESCATKDSSNMLRLTDDI
eukprot:CAMPEP_0114590586 /NCGR_PEP_ID=MMETSP0125-20121206/12814_1 /TAXON_ID=485358 ORGANISM="Aristerostoma sp., Strain ATCC 50986" /NCGR_SAMPLE_ID=MMETSP0125 /ASSEMBLY_ACC=CAM_ASM_000245 /LENGTH=47 /DNA_ID= /DNA_START= /DNA_END= /DNA_ORIENTATION=